MNKKYTKLLEKELKRTFKRKNDWMETALDLQENIDNRIYEGQVSVRISGYILSLIILCGILALFNYFVIWRLL